MSWKNILMREIEETHNMPTEKVPDYFNQHAPNYTGIFKKCQECLHPLIKHVEDKYELGRFWVACKDTSCSCQEFVPDNLILVEGLAEERGLVS